MKKKISKVYYIIIILFIIFSCIYIVSESGYYEYTLQGKTIITREKILEFEDDILNNRDIDIKKYYEEDKSYSNKFTNSINHMSNNIKKISRKIMKGIFKRLSKYLID